MQVCSHKIPIKSQKVIEKAYESISNCLNYLEKGCLRRQFSNTHQKYSLNQLTQIQTIKITSKVFFLNYFLGATKRQTSGSKSAAIAILIKSPTINGVRPAFNVA